MSGLATTIYRALLRLYPRSFRAEYGSELERAWAQSIRGRGAAAAILAAVADVVPNAVAAHVEILMQDLRYTARSLSVSRAFAVTTILVTALGVGANTATFSVADFVLLQPLPFANPDALVRVCEGSTGPQGWGCMNELSPALYRDLRDGARSFESIGAFVQSAMNLTGSGEPTRVRGTLVTPEVFRVLGVPPAVGRVFDTLATGQEPAPTVVISYGLWQSRFGGSPGAIGQPIDLDGTRYTIIGVMPSSFGFPTPNIQLWVPLRFSPPDFEDRGNTYIQGVARLRPGVTFEQARAELGTIAARLMRDHPGDYKNFAFSFFRQRDNMSPRYRAILWSLCGASLCLLLLTCANLANLSLARAARRERELAIRTALGAGRERLVRQMMTESILLALAGGVAGACVAIGSLPLLARLVPSTLPIASSPSLDLRFFGLAAAFAALTGLGMGVLPARRIGGAAGFAALRDGTRGSARRQRLRATLVAVEVAVSVILLVSSGLLIRAIWRVQNVSPGFTADAVLSLRTELPSPAYDDPARRAAFYDRVLQRVRALPGVTAAAYTSGLPMVLTGGIAQVLLPGQSRDGDRYDPTRAVSERIVSARFFATLGIPLQAGRDISESDGPGGPLVAVVSESFAAQHWPGASALGREFEVRNEKRVIVGVVGDIRVRGLERTSEPQIYLPIHQVPDGTGGLYLPKDLVVRSARAAADLVPAIREIVSSVDAMQPVSNVRMVSDVVADQTAARRDQIRILGALAALALLLAGVGIHGLLAFTVAQRDREIGVRLALGAKPEMVGRMIMREAMTMAVAGIIPGVLVAYAAARAMSTLLFGVRPDDPATLAVVAAVCFGTVALGGARPAWRAAHIDPITALKSE